MVIKDKRYGTIDTNTMPIDKLEHLMEIVEEDKNKLKANVSVIKGEAQEKGVYIPTKRYTKLNTKLIIITKLHQKLLRGVANRNKKIRIEEADKQQLEFNFVFRTTVKDKVSPSLYQEILEETKSKILFKNY